MPAGDDATLPPSHSLPVLRAMIDSLDRELLRIMSHRMSIVAEIAAYKRSHGVKIRDSGRETSVLSDRTARAETLGLPVGEIESIFRILMRSSRDRQAELRAEVPPGDEPKTISIIGGEGQFGRLMARLFADLGHRVLIVDRSTELTAEVAAPESDVVVVSVPIDATENVIRHIGPMMREKSLLMDVTSIKEKPVDTMLASTRASVLGTHPMFGPGVHTLQNQRVVLCRARGDGWAAWVSDALRARGLTVTESTPVQHDRAMAIVQVLTHFQTQTLGLTLARLGMPLEETMPFTSPAYLLELYVTARHFDQDPALYGPIEMRNPGTRQVTAEFGKAARDIAVILETGNQQAFENLFGEVRTFFGAFTAEAVEQSSFLIDRIVEHS